MGQERVKQMIVLRILSQRHLVLLHAVNQKGPCSMHPLAWPA